MHTYTLTLIEPTTGGQIADYSRRARNVEIGDASISFEVQMSAWEAIQFLDNPRVYHLVLSRFAKRRIYRVISPTLTSTGLRFEGITLIDGLNDDQYCATWSDDEIGSWRTLVTDDIASAMSDRFSFDFQNRLYIAPEKNATHGAGINGLIGYPGLAGGTRQLRGIQFTYDLTAPVGWTAQLLRRDSAWGSLSSVWALAGNGATQTGSLFITLAACDRLAFLLANTGAAAVFAGETGSVYLKITSIRVVTATTGLINTTLGTTIAAGVRVVTPASMANIVTGRQVTVGTATAGTMERVTVTATTATTFTATFALAHNNTDSVFGFVGLYADEIVRDILAQLVALNSSALASTTARISTPTLDLNRAKWINASPLDILAELAAPLDYVYGVDYERRLYFYARGSYARAWAVRVADLELQRPLEGMANSVRAAYEDAAGAIAHTAYSTNAASVAAIGLTRRRTVEARTTSATQATAVRDTNLTLTKDRQIKIRVQVRRLFSPDGAEWPADQAKPGDTLTILNLPAALAPARKLRTFTVTETGFNPETGLPDIVLESPLPGIDVLIGNVPAGPFRDWRNPA